MTAVPFEYAVVRFVPRVDRGEMLNVGVLLYAQAHDLLALRAEVDANRLRALDPDADIQALEVALTGWHRVCEGGPAAGAAGGLTTGQRFRWLAAPRSTALQVGPVHVGQTDDPLATLTVLFERFVRL